MYLLMLKADRLKMLCTGLTPFFLVPLSTMFGRQRVWLFYLDEKSVSYTGASWTVKEG